MLVYWFWSLLRDTLWFCIVFLIFQGFDFGCSSDDFRLIRPCLLYDYNNLTLYARLGLYCYNFHKVVTQLCFLYVFFVSHPFFVMSFIWEPCLDSSFLHILVVREQTLSLCAVKSIIQCTLLTLTTTWLWMQWIRPATLSSLSRLCSVMLDILSKIPML